MINTLQEKLRKNSISIIVPIFNEDKILQQNFQKWVTLSKVSEIIFVDGGSTDQSVKIARNLGQVILSQKGRAIQMNAGARIASYEQLLFLHADTWITPLDLKTVSARIIKENDIAGCFSIQFTGRGISLRIIEFLGNLRARITKVIYGDQGLLLRKKDFSKLGGFPAVSMMEDVLFSANLKKHGNIAVFREKIYVSSRRFEKQGPITSVFYYSFLYLLFLLKLPLPWIKKLYGDLR